MEEKEKERVKIPSYAKRGKNNSIYALKKDMPYFEDEENPRGHLVIGRGTEDPEMMEPSRGYYWYCTPEALREKEEDRRRREEERLEQIRREEEEEAERKRYLGRTYIRTDQLEDETGCSPLCGFLAEKFFEETGLGGLLTEIFGQERAFWIRLYTAVFFHRRTGTFQYSRLSDFPMKDHMVFEADRFFTASFWESIREEETERFFTEWIRRQSPVRVSALVGRSLLTLYHDRFSDRYGDSFFSSRIRTGTWHNARCIFYRDEDSGRLLAYEGMKLEVGVQNLRRSMEEIFTVRNSTWPSLREADLRLYMYPYHFNERKAASLTKVTLCMLPSEFEDGKEIRRKIKALEKASSAEGLPIVRWEGVLGDTRGRFALLEVPQERKEILEDPGALLKAWKQDLEAMSWVDTSYNFASFYFDVERDEDEFFSPVSEDPFKVRNGKNALKRLTMDAGRYLYFTNGEEIPDQDLIRRQRQEKDLDFYFAEFMNHGETTDLTEAFFSALDGRDFILFLAQAYREWIFEHAGDPSLPGEDLRSLRRDLEAFCCRACPDGSVFVYNEDAWPAFMDRFSVTREEVISYMQANAERDRYFSAEYGRL